jgi:choline dehydrogenase-like flavoprotein
VSTVLVTNIPYFVLTLCLLCNIAAYILPILNRPNFCVKGRAHVTRVLFDSHKRCIGVAYRSGRTREQILSSPEVIVKCRREVILSAGALATPQILLLSGIGPREELDKHHIPVIADLPVGKNLQDHLALGMCYESKLETLGDHSETLGNVWRLD